MNPLAEHSVLILGEPLFAIRVYINREQVILGAGKYRE
jgi:hypothetical protein